LIEKPKSNRIRIKVFLNWIDMTRFNSFQIIGLLNSREGGYVFFNFLSPNIIEKSGKKTNNITLYYQREILIKFKKKLGFFYAKKFVSFHVDFFGVGLNLMSRPICRYLMFGFHGIPVYLEFRFDKLRCIYIHSLSFIN
jgi:hypothetical protein